MAGRRRSCTASACSASRSCSTCSGGSSRTRNAALARGDADGAGGRRRAPREENRCSARRRRGGCAAPPRASESVRWKARPAEEFQVALDDAISAPEAFGASFDRRRPPTSSSSAGPRRRSGDRIPPDARDVRDRRHRDHDARRREVHGMTANAFMSVSLRRRSSSSRSTAARGCRTSCTKARASASTCSRRARRASPTTSPAARGAAGAAFELVHETPLVEGALAHLVARVVRSYWGGDHSLFLGQVEFARYGEGEPLLFHGGRYERLSAISASSRCFRASSSTRSSRSGEEREYADGDAIMRTGSRAPSCCSSSRGRCRWSAPGARSARGRGAHRRDRGARPGRRPHRRHPRGRCRALPRDLARASSSSRSKSDPRAAIALIEVLAARFRETA